MIIKSQRAKKAVLAALADEEMIKILDSVMIHSKSINEIIRETNIAYTILPNINSYNYKIILFSIHLA
jgi:hypothetical protein